MSASLLGTYAAIQPEAKLRPAFTVTKLSGTYDKVLNLFNKKENKIMTKVEKRERGYLVKFAKGHSIHALDDAHLKRIGAGLQMVPMLDDNDEVKGYVPNVIEDERRAVESAPVDLEQAD